MMLCIFFINSYNYCKQAAPHYIFIYSFEYFDVNAQEETTLRNGFVSRIQHGQETVSYFFFLINTKKKRIQFHTAQKYTSFLRERVTKENVQLKNKNLAATQR